MLNRRHLLATTVMLALTGSTAFAQSWSSQYPELVFAKRVRYRRALGAVRELPVEGTRHQGDVAHRQ